MKQPMAHHITLLGMDAKKTTTLSHILKVTCKELNVLPEEVTSKKRNAEIVYARHIYCYLASTGGFNFTLVNIGKFINRDHASVLHARKKISDSAEMYRDIAEKVERIKSLVDNYTIESFDLENITSNHVGYYYPPDKKRALKIWSEHNDVLTRIAV
jgi:chromosomal replication initiator protein